MYGSRTDAPRCTLSDLPTSTHLRRTRRKGAWGDSPNEPLNTRPTMSRSQAFHEQWMDLLDVQDEQAIAQDGLDWEFLFDLDEQVARVVATVGTINADGTVSYTTETPKKQVAARVRQEDRAKSARREGIERLLAQGVRFPDLDPYTLEPYTSNRHPGGYIQVSTSTTRRHVPSTRRAVIH